MWRVLFILTVLTATCEPYTKKPKTPPNRNQRIIKVQGPPHYNHFHAHSKPIRKRPPFGINHGDDFIRPNHPPPIPPFFNGPSTNKVKHLPRPPPHVFHKAPSYGLGFPYKSLPNFRPTITKDHFRVQTVSAIRPVVSSVRPAVSSAPPISSSAVPSTSTGSTISASSTYHSSTFASSFASPPVPHIISSDDNNGPIREIPAPNLAPKHHEYASDIGLGGIGSVGGIELGGVGISGVGIHSASAIGGIGSGVGVHSAGDVGGIHNIGNIGPVHSVDALHGPELGIAAVGGVAHLEPQALVSSVGANPTSVNLNAIVKDQGIEVGTYIKEAEGSHGKEHSVEIANFDEGSSIDVTNLVKDAAGASEHHSGYEVTEHHNHLPSNDQIIKGHDGSKLYYAPDPDPSLPVHKVPPTSDPHSTPSNGQNLNNIYLQQIPHGFSFLQAGSVGSPLSSQELFHYMHGYPAVIQQPLVSFVQQTPGVILGNHQYQSGNAHYSQQTHGNDITRYLQQPEIHNLIHNTPETHHEETPGGAYSSVSQSAYSPQNQPQSYSTTSDNEPNYPTPEINHNFQYEQEAADTKTSLTVIRQTDEGVLNSEKVKELLLEDSTAEQNPPKDHQTIIHLKNIPEVPFYSSLPNQKAAEALASLQAAGSVGSNFLSKIKKTKDGETQGRRVVDVGDIGLQLLEAQKAKEKTVVEVQKSVPLYEGSVSSKNLVEYEGEEEENQENLGGEGGGEEDVSNFDFKEDARSEIFGRRLRPK